MSEPTPLHTDLDRLLAKLVDHFLSDEERSRLETLLAESKVARRHYFHYLDLHAELMARLDQSGIASPPALHLSARPVAPPPAHPLAPSSKTPVFGFFGHIGRRVPGGEFTVGSLLFLVIVAAFWGLSQAILFPKLGSHDLAPESSRLPTVPSSDRAEAVATIRETSEVEWSKNSQSPLAPDKGRGAGGEGTTIAQNQQLQITSGLIELQLNGGTKLLIEGPADWQITGKNSATLTHGKLVAQVPQQAIGFTLETPAAKIVDLGTEFGVEVAEADLTHVVVLQGIVETKPLAAVNAQPVRLTEGQSCQLAPGRPLVLKPVTADQAKFVRSLPGRQAIDPTKPRRVSDWKPVRANSFYQGEQSAEIFPVENVVDGQFDDTGKPHRWSFWLAEDGQPAEFTIDLKDEYLVSEIRLQNTHNRGHNDRGTREYRLSVSRDGTAFNTIREGVLADVAGQESIEWVAIPIEPAIGARYVRFEALSHYGKGAGLNELQVIAVRQPNANDEDG